MVNLSVLDNTQTQLLSKPDDLHGVQIEITSTCNFKCQFCPVSKQGDGLPMPNRKYIDDAKLYELIDQVKDYNLHYFTFSFIGEPMMHPKLFEHIKYATDSGLPFLLVTNGTLFQEKHYQMMQEANLKRLKISLQVADKDTFGTIRGVKMTYDKYLEKVTRVLKAKQDGLFDAEIFLDVGFNPHFTWQNRLLGTYSGDQFIERSEKKLAQDMKDFLNYLTLNGIKHEYDSISVSALKKEIRNYYKNPGYTLDEKILLRIGKTAVLSVKTFWDHFVQNYYPTHRVICKPNKLVVDIDGDVTVCNRDIEKKTVIANIYRDTMLKVFHKVNESIEDVSSGFPQKKHCYYCKGCPTKRGAILRKAFDRPGY